MAKFTKGQVAGAGSGGSARSGEREYTPRLNEIDTETRENRGDKRKSSVEVLPASTAIINVYQLIDKVSPKGKKSKLYYPGGVPGVGFVGFKKLRGMKMPREEAEVVMPKTPSTPKVVTAPQAAKNIPFTPVQRGNDIYQPLETASLGSSDKEVEQARAYYVKMAANGKEVIYDRKWEKIGRLRPLKGESNDQYKKRNAAYKELAEKLDEMAAKQSMKNAEELNKTIKGSGAEAKKAVSFNASPDKKNAMALISRDKVHYTISGEPYANNSRYVRRSVSNPEDLKIIIKAINNVKKLGMRFDEKPYPIVAVGTNMNSPSTTHDVYISGGLGNFEARRKKPMPTKAKRNMKKIPNKKHRVVMKRKGGRK